MSEPTPALNATTDASVVEPGRTSTLAALRYRDYRLFWIGHVISNVGTWMQMFGQGWLVVQLAVRDGTPQLAPFYLGLVGLSRAIPGLGFGLFGGAVADRRSDRRRLLMITQSAAALSSAVLATLTISERIGIGEVLLLGALNSVIFSFDAPTRQAMVPRLVPRRHLMSAIGLNQAGFNGPQIIGPVIGGLLIVPVGVGGLFAVNAATYLAVLLALLWMAPIAVQDGTRDTSLVRSVRDGLGYIRREPVIRWVIVLAASSALLARPYIQLLAAFAYDILRVGAVELSWLLAASGVGSLAGSFATASVGRFRRRGLMTIGSGGAVGALLVVFALQRSFPLSLALLAATGFFVVFFNGLGHTLLQTRTPDHLRGRVMSVFTMIFMGVMPLGIMVLGAAGSLIGIDAAMAIGAALVTALALYAGFGAPALRTAGSETVRRPAVRAAG